MICRHGAFESLWRCCYQLCHSRRAKNASRQIRQKHPWLELFLSSSCFLVRLDFAPTRPTATRPRPGKRAPGRENDCLTFEAALDDAAQPATPGKVSNVLLAIVPPRQYAGSWPTDSVNTARLHGGKIIWEGLPGNSRIRVAAFMDTQTYMDWYYPCMFGGTDKGGKQHPAGGEAVSVLTKGLWVTVTPELRNFFWNRSVPACPQQGEGRGVAGAKPEKGLQRGP